MTAHVARLVLALVLTGSTWSSAFAANLPFTASLAIDIAQLQPVTVPGSGTALINGSGGGGHLDTLALPADVFDASGVVVPISDPAVFPVLGVQLTVANQPGTIMAGSGPIPLAGYAKVCLFGPCSAPVANLNVPLAVVGNGGAGFITGSVNLTVIGSPWTTGTAAIGTITQMGYAYGPASAASSTAMPSGQLRLVSPIFVSTNIGSSAVIPAFAILSLHFVPEPGTLALLAGGLAIAAAAGRRRLARG